MGSERDAGQVIQSAAEVYEEFFLPALFAAWPPRLIEAAKLGPGMDALDVACGTGVLAVAAAHAVGADGSTAAVDLNPGMLTLARSKADRVDWREAPAEALPFEAASFDAVLSQFGLMFFADREQAIREMWRVLRPGGRLAVAVWDSLAATPGYSAVVALLDRLFGPEIASLLEAPYCLGDAALLETLFRDGGVPAPTVTRATGQADFPSIRSWMHTDVRGWTLADKLDDAQFERLVDEAERECHRFVQPDGRVRFPHDALIVTAERTS